MGRNTTKYTNVKNTTCCLDIFGWVVTNGRTALQNVEKENDKVINDDITQLRNEGATNIRKDQQ